MWLNSGIQSDSGPVESRPVVYTLVMGRTVVFSLVMGMWEAEQCIQCSIWPLCSRTVVYSLVKGLLVEQNRNIYSSSGHVVSRTVVCSLEVVL